MQQLSALKVTPLAAGRLLPLVVEPKAPGVRLGDVARDIASVASAELERGGGLLFRGFDVPGVDDFQRFAASFGHPLLSYDFASTPRGVVSAGVYSSTEYPAHQSIPLHNEQSYAKSWPLKIWFYCSAPPASGGETPIADSRLVYQRIPARIRERWAARGLLYVRNYGGGLDLPWPKVFNTSNRLEVEAYCRTHDIAWEWKSNGELRTRQVCQAVARHPRTGEDVWFNQAHLFHVSALEPEVREVLLDAVGEEDLPRNVYYADNTPLEETLLDEVRAVLETCKVEFSWQASDLLMLDNMLVAHGRNPFSGPRRVVVAMAEPFGASAR